MKTVFNIVTFIALCTCVTVTAAEKPSPVIVHETEWQWWRGPNRDGIARNQVPPTKWSSENNIIWRTPVPGRGHSSPTVFGGRVFIATAEKDPERQSVICLDRANGNVLWVRVVHDGKVGNKGNKKASRASGSVSCDGSQIYISFVNGGALYTTAMNLNGERQWQRKIQKYVIHQGYGASPVVYGELVIISADNKGGGAIAALNRRTGKLVWKQQRPATPNYSSPSPLKIEGKNQLLLSGCNLITSYDPLTGKKIWEVPGATTECVTTMVSDGELVYSSGGYPRNHVMAVRAKDQKVVWQKPTRVYVPSMLVYNKHLYAVTDRGVAYCWHCKTGKTAWQRRFGGVFSASLTLANNRIYATNERGTTFVYSADTDGFKLIAKNKLGDECYSSPAFAGNRIFTRIAERRKGARQEYVVCIGQ